jgi:hypothetical protein
MPLPIRVIDGEEYYVVPIHPSWRKLIDAAGGLEEYSKKMGIEPELTTMTDEEMSCAKEGS